MTNSSYFPTWSGRTHNTEKGILESVEDRRRQAQSNGVTSQEEIKHTVVAKMKILTNAEEDVCIELLESNKYDLNTSIEAYFARP